jgi:hypothetical protein
VNDNFARFAFLALAVASLWSRPVLAEEALVTLKSPVDGEKLAVGKTYKAEYKVREGAKAHHVHLFVDGAEVGTAHKHEGSFSLGPLKAGERKICVAPVNKGHAPIGEQSCVTVIVQ